MRALRQLWIVCFALIVCACGTADVCPPGFRPGVYGCIITCANVPPDSGLECFMYRDGEVIDRMMDVTTDVRDATSEVFDADASVVDDVIDVVDVVDVADVQDAMVTVDPAITAPRAVAPLSTSTVTSQRPTLRWSNGPMADSAVVELSRTRDFAMVTMRLQASGDRVRPPSTLTAGVWFWRLRGRSSMRNAEGSSTSPVWWFRVGARSADGDRDTSWGTELDVNGDGYADVAVGSPGADMGRGRVDLFYGGPSGIGMMPSVTLRGAAMGDRFGESVASAGDVNGDGFGDFVVGAPSVDISGRADSGTATVYLGSATGLVLAPLRVLEGVAMGDTFGDCVAAAGDVNSDGFSDLVVGAPGADPSGRSNAGTATVYFGGASGPSASARRVLEGSMNDDAFGDAVAGAGDVNGDGFGDLVVGAPSADPVGRLSAGTASIFVGGMSGLSASPAPVLEGVAMGDLFGVAVASAGDLNGDGLCDVVVGAIRASPGGNINVGSASVFLGSASGLTASALRVLEGGSTDDFFGIAVASAGDVNGDGYSDLVVGARFADPMSRTNAGAATVYAGAASGLALAAPLVLEGAAPGDGFGTSVASAGDANGDGYSDLIVGANFASPPSGANAGVAAIFSGSATGLVVSGARLLEGAATFDAFGSSVAYWRGKQFDRVRWASVQTVVPLQLAARELACRASRA